MESDLSLIEISGEEDDSLLPHIPPLSTTSAPYFSCSPLQIPRSTPSAARFHHASPHKSLKDGVKVAKPRCSSPSSSSNKENMNMHKTDVPKLSLEPQQMKRKKKGGGYNLRKSLAWDKAFFTEEGVLDSQELSVLSGHFGHFSGEGLSVIHEEGTKSSFSESNCSSANMRVPEEKIFKRIPARSQKENTENCGGSFLKHDSSSQGNVTPKVLLNNCRRTESRGRICPRPLPLSSLKRPANASTTKTAMKESKLPRIPASKSNTFSAPTPSKSTVLNTSHSKHNQIAQSDSLQKTVEIKVSSRSTKNVSNKANTGPGCVSSSSKSSLQHTRRDTGNSTLKIDKSINPRPPLVSKRNEASEVTPGPVLPLMQALHSYAVSTKSGVSLPQKSNSAGGTSPIQTARPSGLRMPSPSLGFFGQAKSSSSLGSSQRSTQSCNLQESSIPRLWKPGASNDTLGRRPSHATGNIPKIVSDSSTRGDARVSGCSEEWSASCSVYNVSPEKTKLTLEVKVPCNCESFEEEKGDEEMQNTSDVNKESAEHAEPFKVQQSSYNVEAKLEKADSRLLSQSGFHDQVKRHNSRIKETNAPEWRNSDASVLENPECTIQHTFGLHVEGVSGTNDTTEHQYLEDRDYNSSGKDLVILNEQSREQSEVANSSVSIADQISLPKYQCSETNFEESHKCEGNISDVNLKPQTSSRSELDSSFGQYWNEITEQPNRDDSEMGDLTSKSHAEDAILLAESFNSGSSTLVVHTQCSNFGNVFGQPGGDPESRRHTGPRNPCFIVEQASQITHELLSDGYLLLEENVPSEEPRKVNTLESISDVVPERSHESGSEPEVSNASIAQEPGAMYNGVVAVDVMVEQAYVEAALSGPMEIFPSAENHCGSVERQSSHDIKLSTESTSEFDSYLSRELRSLSPSAQTSNRSVLEGIGVIGLNNNFVVDVAGMEISSPNRPVENQKTESCDLVLIDENRSLEESQIGDFSNSIYIFPEARDSTECELRSSHKPSQIKHTGHSYGGEAGVDDMTNQTQMGDAKFDGSSLVGNCDRSPSISIEQAELQNPCTMHECAYMDNGELHLNDNLLLGENTSSAKPMEEIVPETAKNVAPEQSQVLGNESKSFIVAPVPPVIQHSADVEKVEDSYMEDAPSGSLRTEPSEENYKYTYIDAECRHDTNFCECASQDNHGLQLNDNLLIGSNSSSEELREENFLGSVENVISEDSHVYGSELISSSVVAFVPLAIQDDGSRVGKIAEDPRVDTSSGSLGIEPLDENRTDTFLYTKLRHDMELCDQATSLGFDSALMLSKDQTKSVIDASKADCSTSGESYLLVKSVQTSSNASTLGVGVDGMKCISSDETDDNMCLSVINRVGDLHGELDNITCLSEDEAAKVIKKSENGMTRDHPLTKPPVNAIPFSDEWLAAMEAAGEDILSMKGGAVQNSPPEKSEHEPSPWSPVKRKTNQIGPFDCTKFTNVPPSDSL